MRAESRLILFARAPEPGKVKTRLISVLGADAAAALHRAMVSHCLEVACSALPGNVELWCTPDATDPFFEQCALRWDVKLREQGDGDLGSRMSAALLVTLKVAQCALIMGTDVVSISADDIRQAVAHLQANRDAVVYPTHDGGYGLLGLRRHDERLFANVDWGTSAVMDQTRARLATLRWNWLEMPMRWDVDEPSDLARLAEFPSLAALARTSPG